jgi:hypothetical protein
MMVLHDYVSKRIMPLQERTRPTWLYTEVNDVTRLARCDRSVLGEEALVLVMGKLSPDLSSHDFITPPASCQPLCMDQVMRTLLLGAMPSMDDIGIAPFQRGDQSRGIDPWDRHRGWPGWCCLHSGTQQEQGEGGTTHTQS